MQSPSSAVVQQALRAYQLCKSKKMTNNILSRLDVILEDL